MVTTNLPHVIYATRLAKLEDIRELIEQFSHPARGDDAPNVLVHDIPAIGRFYMDLADVNLVPTLDGYMTDVLLYVPIFDDYGDFQTEDSYYSYMFHPSWSDAVRINWTQMPLVAELNGDEDDWFIVDGEARWKLLHLQVMSSGATLPFEPVVPVEQLFQQWTERLRLAGLQYSPFEEVTIGQWDPHILYGDVINVEVERTTIDDHRTVSGEVEFHLFIAGNVTRQVAMGYIGFLTDVLNLRGHEGYAASVTGSDIDWEVTHIEITISVEFSIFDIEHTQTSYDR